MSTEIWQLEFTARHFLKNLVRGLYEGPAACLMEIIRNGLIAGMPKNQWRPKSTNVELLLVPNHPLAPDCLSLVTLDHGSGITDDKVRLYKTVGPAMDDEGPSHSGGAANRIGRFGGIGYNERSMKDEDISTGFFVLTRTTETGPVKKVSMIPRLMEIQKGALVVETIPGDSPELGPHQGIKGSFTAVVTPYSMFKTYDEIRLALKWMLPRKPDLMYRLYVGGKLMTAPPLASRISVVQEGGGVEAYIDRDKEAADKPEGGVWIADAETGIRVASAVRLGRHHVPYPLWRPDLTGDIFIPRALANQGTSRSGLLPQFLASDEWKNPMLFCVGQVCPKVKALYGDEDAIGQSSATKSAFAVINRFREVWGVPKGVNGGVPNFFEDIVGDNAGQSKASKGNGHGGGGVRRGSRGAQLNPSKGKKPRAMPFNIGKREFVLGVRAMDERLFAEVDRSSGDTIYINAGEYVGLPTTAEARDEHILLMILGAAAAAERFDDIKEVTRFVAERRRELMGRKK